MNITTSYIGKRLPPAPADKAASTDQRAAGDSQAARRASTPGQTSPGPTSPGPTGGRRLAGKIATRIAK